MTESAPPRPACPPKGRPGSPGPQRSKGGTGDWARRAASVPPEAAGTGPGAAGAAVGGRTAAGSRTPPSASPPRRPCPSLRANIYGMLNDDEIQLPCGGRGGARTVDPPGRGPRRRAGRACCLAWPQLSAADGGRPRAGLVLCKGGLARRVWRALNRGRGLPRCLSRGLWPAPAAMGPARAARGRCLVGRPRPSPYPAPPARSAKQHPWS